MLAKEPEDSVARRAAISIASYGNQGEAILLKFAAKKDPKLRSTAINALADVSETVDAKTVKAVIHQLNDPDSSVRMAVLNLIGRCRYEDAVSDVLGMIKADKDEEVRLAAIVRMSDIEAKSKTIAPVLIDVLRDGDTKWTGRNKSEYKDVVAASLGFLGHNAMAFVVAALRDPKSAKDVRLAMIAALDLNIHKYKFPDGLGEVGACLNDSDPEIRTRALEVLRNFRTNLIAPYKGRVDEIVRTSSSRAEFESAAHTLIEIDPGSVTVHKQIRLLLQSSEPTQREMAIRIIDRTGSRIIDRYIKDLPAYLVDKDEKVQLAAISALRSRVTKKQSEILALLKRAADEDSNQRVRASAREAYEHITKDAAKKAP